MFCSGSYKRSLLTFSTRLISALVGGGSTFLIFCVPNPLRWLIGGKLITYSSLFLMALYSATVLKAEVVELLLLLRYTTDKRVVVEAKRKKVKEAMRNFERNPEKVLRASNPSTVYDFDPNRHAGGGAFGLVFLGRTKDAPFDDVAIKKMIDRGSGESGTKRENDKKLFGGIAAALLVLGYVGPGTMEGFSFNKLTLKIREDLNLEDKEVKKNWKIESRTLFAVASLDHPSLLKFYSSHEHSGAFYIVSKQIIPKGLQGQPLLIRLSAVQSFFRGVEELHSAGIVHRDLKIDNVGVAKGDPSRAVILDFGTSELPYEDNSDDSMIMVCDNRYATPEQTKLWNSMPSQALISLTHGYQGPPSDVWAAGLTAIEMVLLGTYGCASIDSIYSLAYNHHSDVLGSDRGKTPQRWLKQPRVVQGPRGPVQNGEYPGCIPDHITPNVIKMLLCVVRQHWKQLCSGSGAEVPDVDGFCDLISRMLSIKRENRPRMREAATDEFFQKNKIGEYADFPLSAGTAAASSAASAASAASLFTHSSSASVYYSELQAMPAIPLKLLAEVSAMLVASGVVAANPMTRDEVLYGPIVARLKGLFRTYADGQSGEITSKDKMLALMKESGLQKSLLMDDKRVEGLWDLLDWDGNGSVSKLELFAGLSILLVPMASDKTRAELLFHACDENDDSFISLQEMVNLLAVFNWTEGEATSLFLRLDKMDVKKISKDKFLEGIIECPLFRETLPGTQPKRYAFGYV